MAREGRFGHLPRAAPNLSGLIVQMVREIAAQDDANMLNAWEEGGEVDGKPVTDQRLLAHFKKRRDDIPKSDPEWDKWDQALTNYTFSIAESKMTLQYAQHKVGEGEMAGFYRKWAQKLPVNSEAYRELMRSAAQFADAANARSAAASSGANQAAYDSASNAAYNKYERRYENVNTAIMAAAQRLSILQPGGPITPDLVEDLRGAYEHDHARFADMFDQIDAGGPDDPMLGDIYRYLREQGYEHLTLGQFQQLSASKVTGLEARIRIATQFDDASGAKTLRSELLDQVYTNEKIGDIDEFAAYQRSEAVVQSAMASGQYSPPEMAEMLAGHMQLTDRLRMTATSDEDRGFFNAHFMNLNGEPVVAPGPFEITEGGGMTPQSAQSYIMGQQKAMYDTSVREVNAGRAIWSMQLVPDATDPRKPDRMEWGTVAVTDPAVLDPDSGTIVFTAFNTKDAKIAPVQTMKRPIYVSVIDESGQTVKTQVGWAYPDTNGKRRYAIFSGDGAERTQRFMANLPVRREADVFSGDGEVVINVRPGLLGNVAAGAVPGTGGRGEVMAPDIQSVWQPWFNLKRWVPGESKVIGEYDNEWDLQFDLSTQTRTALMRAKDDDLWLMAQQVPANQEVRGMGTYLPGGEYRRGPVIGTGPQAAYQYFADYRQNAVVYHNEHVAENLDRAMVWRAGREAAATGKPFSMTDTRLSAQAQLDATAFEAQQPEAHSLAVTKLRQNMPLTVASIGGGFQREAGGATAVQESGAARLAGPQRLMEPSEQLARFGTLEGGQRYTAATRPYGQQPGQQYGQPTLKLPTAEPYWEGVQRKGFVSQLLGTANVTPNLARSMTPAQQALTREPTLPRTQIDPRLMRRSDEPTIRTPRFRPPVFATPRSSGAGSADMQHWLERFGGGP